jgi:hypothetical protein
MFRDLVMELGTVTAAYGKIEWMLAQPKNWCRCTGKRSSGNKFGYSKTKRFGWWVHATCNRPTKMVVQKFIGNLMNGHHDILDELRPQETPEEMPQAEEKDPINVA